MRRREFIAAVSSAVAAWPLAAHAQQVQRPRLIGVLMGWSETNPYRLRTDALVEGLAALGWKDKSNLRLDVRWTNGDVERARPLAKELVEQKPDVLVAGTTVAAAALRHEAGKIPIVFAAVSDPVGAGFVQSLPRPGGNMTGFINLEASMGGKWLELLKEVAPRLKRVALMFNPDTAPGGGAFFQPAFEAAARALKIETITSPIHSDAEIEKAVESLGRERGGLVLGGDSFASVHRRTIIAATALQKVPFIKDAPDFSREGALITYGPDPVDIFRRCTSYVDRILKGANPGELPVQVPTKFELTINLKTAKALGLGIPQTLLATADEVIQ